MPQPVLVAMETRSGDTTRWEPRPRLAALLRAFVFLAPIAASVAFVHFASSLIVPPGRSSCPRRLVDRPQRRRHGRAHRDRPADPAAAATRGAAQALARLPRPGAVALQHGAAPGTRPTSRSGSSEAREGAGAETPVEAAARLLELVAALNTHDRLTRGHCERVRAYSQMIARSSASPRGARPAQLGRAAARRRQARGARGDPQQARAAERRGVGVPPQPPRAGRALASRCGGGSASGPTRLATTTSAGTARATRTGSRGDEIPLAGRIVAVADVFDVITSARSYKKPRHAVAGARRDRALRGRAVRPARRARVPQRLARPPAPRHGAALVARAGARARPHPAHAGPRHGRELRRRGRRVGRGRARRYRRAARHAAFATPAATAATTSPAKVAQRTDPAPLPAPLRHGGAARALPVATPALQLATAPAPAPAVVSRLSRSPRSRSSRGRSAARRSRGEVGPSTCRPRSPRRPCRRRRRRPRRPRRLRRRPLRRRPRCRSSTTRPASPRGRSGRRRGLRAADRRPLGPGDLRRAEQRGRAERHVHRLQQRTVALHRRRSAGHRSRRHAHLHARGERLGLRDRECPRGR